MNTSHPARVFGAARQLFFDRVLPAAGLAIVKAGRGLCTAMLVAIVAAGWGRAMAANADVNVTLTPLPAAVSLSQAGYDAFFAVEVTIRSGVTNVNNAVVFSASVTGSPIFQSVLGASGCPLGSTFSDTEIVCKIGQMGGNSTTKLVVIYKSPTTGTSIDFPWNLTYSTAGSQASTPSGTTFSGTMSVALLSVTDQRLSKELGTYLPPVTGSSTGTYVIFTGSNNGTALSKATEADKLTAKLEIPKALLGLSTVTVEQAPAAGGQTNDTLTTNTTTIRIPAPLGSSGQVLFFGQSGTDVLTDPTNYKPITIYLQRDSSTIRSFQGYGRAPIYYKAAADEPAPYDAALKNCADLVGGGPTYENPVCIADRFGLSKKGGAIGEDIGDWLFVLKALQNGVSRW